jgi:N-acetylated-alpha-linked acidic dipeptidase
VTRFLLGLALCAAPLAAQQPTPVRGFPADALAAELRVENAARAVPNPDSVRVNIRLLSAVPHEAGTERSRHVAETILARFKSFGLDAHIEPFEALMPRPVSRLLELVGPEHYTATLREPALAEDSTSGQSDQLPTFNAYSADGDVTGDLVYVNYGVPDDYKVLDSLGISVQGKIVIARYGGSWRGVKVKVAAEHGAVGCIIYSDPRDDGYFEKDVYPKGPMRPGFGVQRGSVMDMPLYPGDPLSPGWASVPGDPHRLPIAQAATIEKIPVLPISYDDALPLLRNLTGPVAPEPWRGALPITYHLGAGPARVHLAVSFEWKTRPLYDVIATIPGSTDPDQWVIYGNHHDAWVNGAEDPISGQVALEETARSLGALLKTGWKPARTVVFAAWDGEEWGLLGSTEWAERHAPELEQKAVVYYNSDTNDRGWLDAAGSHSLEAFLEQVARDVRDPVSGKSVLEAALAHRRTQRGADSVADTLFHLGALGSGSDYSAFIDHLAVPSIATGFGGGTPSGIYHSVYDSYTFYDRFLDSAFAYGVTEAQTMATAVLRMADAPLLPYEFTRAAHTYSTYVDEIEKAAKKTPATAALDLSGVRAALTRLDTAAAEYDRVSRSLADAPSAGLGRRRAALSAVNQTLARAERALSDTGGLPRRAWYRHLLYAPGFYTGYGVKTMPGIREGVDQGKLAEAQAEAVRVAAALDRYAATIHQAAQALAPVLAH